MSTGHYRRQEDADARRRVRLSFIALCVVIGLAISVTGYFVDQNRHRIGEGREAHDALCVVRANYEKRVRRTTEFLEANKAPIIIGIDRRILERALAEDQATLLALDELRCVPPPQPTTE